MKALRIEVYRNGYDCTLGGVSSKFNELLLVCERGNTDVDENNLPENLVKIVTRNIFGMEYKHIEPYLPATQVGWMAGGNIGYTCDSRFTEMSTYPLSIHDRQESQAVNDMMSR